MEILSQSAKLKVVLDRSSGTLEQERYLLRDLTGLEEEQFLLCWPIVISNCVVQPSNTHSFRLSYFKNLLTSLDKQPFDIFSNKGPPVLVV